MEQAKINFFGPLIAVVVLISSALLLGFVILKKNRNILSTNQSKLLLVIHLYHPSTHRLYPL